MATCNCNDTTKSCCGMTETETTTVTRKYGSDACDMPAGTRMYIGGRYVLKFHNPIIWDSSVPYEYLEVVQHNAYTYISKKAVPAGVQIDNTEFWLLWADPNAQMEELRRLVENYINDVADVEAAIEQLRVDLNQRIAAEEAERTAQDSILSGRITTEEEARTSADENLQQLITAERTSREEDSARLKSEIDAERVAREEGLERLTNEINSEISNREEADSELRGSITGINNELATISDDLLEIEDRIKYNLQNLNWNCEARAIVTTNDQATTNSVQGFTMCNINGRMFAAQAAVINSNGVIILYDYTTSIEVARVSGNYGHLNSLSYDDGKLYALNDETQTVYIFTLTERSIAYNQQFTPSIGIGKIYAIEMANGYAYCVSGNESNLVIYRCNKTITSYDLTYQIPYKEWAIVQGLSVRNSDVFIATTSPNVIVYYNMETEYYYFTGMPRYIGHCYIDELEGVYFDGETLYTSTFTTVDLQVMFSVFESNVYHNTPRESSAGTLQNRYDTLTAHVNYNEGSLISPTRAANRKFKLVGDALNYAKSLGGVRVIIMLETDYPLCIVANDSKIQISTADNSTKTLYGLLADSCDVTINSMGYIRLEAVDILPMRAGGKIYGAVLKNCSLNIPYGTNFVNPSTPYNESVRKMSLTSTTANIPETKYYDFYNSIVSCAGNVVDQTATFSRTGFIFQG